MKTAYTLLAAAFLIVSATPAGALQNNGSGSHAECVGGGEAVFDQQYDQTWDSCSSSNGCDSISPGAVRDACWADCDGVAESSGFYFANQYYNDCRGFQGGSSYCSPTSPWC